MYRSHEIEVYVRFCETDLIGHVNNTSHFLYFEEARTRFLKDIYPNKPENLTFIVANINCSYLNEAFYDQTLTVSTNIKEIGTTSYTILQTLENKSESIIVAKAETIVVCFDYPSKRSIKVPDVIYEKFKEICN